VQLALPLGERDIRLDRGRVLMKLRQGWKDRVRRVAVSSRLYYGLGVFVMGIALIIVGGILNGLSPYMEAVFVNVGTAMALFGPLLLIERQLDRRITDVGRQAERAGEQARVAVRQAGDLSERVQAGLREVREEDEVAKERAAKGEHQEDLVALYRRAASYGSIDRLGLRIAAPDPFEIWMRIRVISREEDGEPVDLVELSFEDQNLNPLGGTVLWSPGEPAEEVFLRLAKHLQQVGAWLGDDAYDPLAILSAFATALGRIIDIWSGPGGNPQVRPVAALLGSDWAVTRMGLDSLRTPDLWAEAYELIGDTHHAYLRMENQVKVRGWDALEFRAAFTEAERVHRAFAAKSPARR
jgi:hypothetical protein